MPTLNIPQGEFLQLPHKFRAYVAGYGSGKTTVGCYGLGAHAWEWPGIDQAYFAPSYPLIRDIFYPTIEETAFELGLNARIKIGDHEVELYEGSRLRSTILCRSMDNPASIIGFKSGHSLVDELDTMPKEKARTAWRKIIARMRYKVDGLKNGIDVTTTPEGFRFVHEQFVEQLLKKPELGRNYGLIQASTYDNEINLPNDYIASLYEAYPPNLIEAYINGQFVNLQTGTVYSNFDRRLNHTDETIKPNEALHIGMDFNIGRMAAAVCAIRDGVPYLLEEVTHIFDTPAMISELKFKYANHHITVYPDASGKNRKSVGGSETDHSLLRQAGFVVRTDAANPGVRDRVLSVNAMFLNAQGARRFKVNTDKCPWATSRLEQQAYSDSGEPEKDGTEDINDAIGYFINQRFPALHRRERVTPLEM